MYCLGQLVWLTFLNYTTHWSWTNCSVKANCITSLRSSKKASRTDWYSFVLGIILFLGLRVKRDSPHVDLLLIFSWFSFYFFHKVRDIWKEKFRKALNVYDTYRDYFYLVWENSVQHVCWKNWGNATCLLVILQT